MACSTYLPTKLTLPSYDVFLTYQVKKTRDLVDSTRRINFVFSVRIDKCWALAQQSIQTDKNHLNKQSQQTTSKRCLCLTRLLLAKFSGNVDQVLLLRPVFFLVRKHPSNIRPDGTIRANPPIKIPGTFTSGVVKERF